MWLVLLLAAVGIAVVALLLFFAFKAAPAAPVWEKLDDTKTPAASAGRAVGSSGTERTLPGAIGREDQEMSRAEKRVPVDTGGPSYGADTRRSTGTEGAMPPTVSGETTREKSVRKDMWVDSHYCWVVLCKNHWFHIRQNLFFRHRIPLAETDPLAPRPSLDGHFRVRCDDCSKEYFYKPSDVLRFEQELPESFTPHPLFRSC
jgi:hypothetical protein